MGRGISTSQIFDLRAEVVFIQGLQFDLEKLTVHLMPSLSSFDLPCAVRCKRCKRCVRGGVRGVRGGVGGRAGRDPPCRAPIGVILHVY